MTTPPEIYTSRDQWLAARRGSLGASEVAGILGQSRYCSPLTLYLRERARLAQGDVRAWDDVMAAEDLGIQSDDYADAEEETEAQEAGLAYESVNAQRYAKRTGRELVALGGSSTLYRHPSGLRMHASPDAVQLAPDRVGHAPLELKHWGAPPSTWREHAPLAVQIQGLVQAECMGASWFTCAAVLQGVRLVWHDTEHHRELAAQILERVADFWRHVQVGKEPPASAQDVGFLRDWYQSSTGVSVQLEAPEAATWREELKAAKVAAKEAEATIDRIKAQAMASLGEGETLLLDGSPIATWKEQDAPVMQKVGTRRSRVFRWKL